MAQGTNGRGSFGDVLLALAGGLLAADAQRVRGVEAQSATVDYAGGTFTLKPGQIWDYENGTPAPSRITRITTQCVEYTCEVDGCRGHEVSVIDFCADLIKLGGKLRQSDSDNSMRGVEPGNAEGTPAALTQPRPQGSAEPAAEDPVAEVNMAMAEVSMTVVPCGSGHVMVSAGSLNKLHDSIARLSAGKVAKPATLHQPSAAASRNDFATATEAAEPSPADPLAQAMGLIPNTYVEDENNICAAISNMVSHIDRLKRSVERLTGNDAVNRVCESCRAAVQAAMGKGDIPGVVKTTQS